MGKVKNLNGTKDYKPEDAPAWLKGWESVKKVTAKECLHINCKSEDKSKNLVGAHVKKDSSEDNRWYIVPLCKKCNKIDSDEVFSVYYDDLVLVNDINKK